MKTQCATENTFTCYDFAPSGLAYEGDDGPSDPGTKSALKMIPKVTIIVVPAGCREGALPSLATAGIKATRSCAKALLVARAR